MKLFNQQYGTHLHSLTPTDEIAGFPVRPGMFDINGAMALPIGVSFTIHTNSGTSSSAAQSQSAPVP